MLIEFACSPWMAAFSIWLWHDENQPVFGVLAEIMTEFFESSWALVLSVNNTPN